MKKQLILFSLFCIAFLHLKEVEAAKSRSSYVGRKVSGRTSRRIKTEGIEMRKVRRVAIGGSVGGALGALGANMELNLTPMTGFVGGYGGGPGYRAFSLQVKNYIVGDSFLPFIGAGYARWFNNPQEDQAIESSKPGFLVDSFLNDEEKQTGRFSVDLIYPSVGAQYVNLTGDWAGTSIVVEVMMLVDLGSLKAAPTGSIGMMYYF